MTSRERVWAALKGAPVDRPPVSFWGHAYHRESTAEALADATLERWREGPWDWVKLNPRKHYHVEPWGVRYAYSGVPDEKPVLSEWPIREATDWAKVTPQPHDQGALGEQLEAVRLVRRALPADVPLIQTVFTPLAVLGEMTETPEELAAHMRSHPEFVRQALEAVTTTYERYARAVIAAGADGLFFATVDWASADYITAEDHRTWSRPFDLRVLSAVADAPFHVLHVCGSHNLLFELADYPVRAFSWASTDPTNPSLADALARVPGAVMGGISQAGSLVQPAPEAALEEYRVALDQTGGRRWLVAPGCSIPPDATQNNMRAVRDAVHATRLAGDDARG